MIKTQTVITWTNTTLPVNECGRNIFSLFVETEKTIELSQNLVIGNNTVAEETHREDQDFNEREGE